MAEIGYSLSSEEHSALDLVRFAQHAEESGFTFALISDHFHPWTSTQGESPFVWSVIGGIAACTRRLRLGTGVTCPLLRMHPAIIAQAASTAATMMPGRFFLGVGTGENLNEHIVGDKWPPSYERREMLEESIDVIRLLWKGNLVNHRGRYFRVENARLFSLPPEAPPIMIAASGEKTAELAARTGDGLISVGANRKIVERFESVGGQAKPKYGQLTVCWAASEKAARKTAYQWWPIAGMAAPLLSELALPSYFEAVGSMVSEIEIEQAIVCGPDPNRHLDAIHRCIEVGFDHIYIYQVGKDQEGFLRFYESQILPEFGQRGIERFVG